jgi:hypothetical protein
MVIVTQDSIFFSSEMRKLKSNKSERERETDRMTVPANSGIQFVHVVGVGRVLVTGQMGTCYEMRIKPVESDDFKTRRCGWYCADKMYHK